MGLTIKHRKALIGFWPVALFLILGGCRVPSQPKVIIATSLGNIVVAVDTLRAKITGKNFLLLVERGAYKNSYFYRTVRLNNQPAAQHKIEVIQGGLFYDSLIVKYSEIAHEPTSQTGLFHVDGTISMARLEPGTASTEFFICLGNQPELDYGGRRNPDGQGFAAFGRVVSGMDVVRKIHQLPDTSQYLVSPVARRWMRIEK
ncbi:MAG TPA: peptidylprolyl isomerase [Williamwhitmania sp.]|nr:peptidylprolyl isomerase [Williamwhitmania sp.]